jgi:hypothetical protein
MKGLWSCCRTLDPREDTEREAKKASAVLLAVLQNARSERGYWKSVGRTRTARACWLQNARSERGYWKLEAGTEVFFAVVVAERSIRERILKDHSMGTSLSCMDGCRTLDPREDTESNRYGILLHHTPLLQNARSERGYWKVKFNRKLTRRCFVAERSIRERILKVWNSKIILYQYSRSCRTLDPREDTESEVLECFGAEIIGCRTLDARGRDGQGLAGYDLITSWLRKNVTIRIHVARSRHIIRLRLLRGDPA